MAWAVIVTFAYKVSYNFFQVRVWHTVPRFVIFLTAQYGNWCTFNDTNVLMKKISCILVFVLSIFSVYAQSQDLREEMQILVQRVDTLEHELDSLEHELSYLKLAYEMNTLNYDITMFNNEVINKSLEIRLFLYNQNFDSELGDSYQQYYKACRVKEQAISELIEAKRTFLAIKIITYPYTESETKVLMASDDAIDSSFDTLKAAMKVLKFVVDTYNEYL